MKYIIKLLLCFIIIWIGNAHAEIRIEITKGVNTAQPIGIVPFKWNGTDPLPYNIEQIITADLQNSGKFNPIDHNHIPQQPTIASEVISNSWIALGINSIVIGYVQPVSDSQYIIDYQLIDVVNSPCIVLIKNQLKISRKWLRYAAHTISNEVFEKLTGIRGAFNTRISYVLKVNDIKFPYELRVSDYDGYNQFIIHRSKEPLMSPAWSADGEKIAYVTFESGSSSLVIKTLVTGEVSTVTSFPCHNGAPTFSPDGTKLAFVLSRTGSLNLYVKDLKNGKINQITYGRNNNTEPNWMPDSQTLIYTSDETGRPQIYKLNINIGVPERITWVINQNQDPSVSHDGKFMVMVNSYNGKQRIVKQDLQKANEIEYLTDTFLDETPSISPNNTMIIYSSSQGFRTVLQLVSTDGHFKACISAANGQIRFPAWSPYL
ncbi:MAG: Tol-Pal system beta propeller repeat protein TolB [Arsenophonus sp. ER-QC15-MAG3]